MTDTYRVLTVEDDPDPTTYLRLALLRTTWHTEHPVRCPASVRAVLRAVTSTTRAGSNDPTGDATWGPARPITLILDETPARLEVLTAYFDDAGCAVIPVTDIEQALSMCSVLQPDLMVLPQPPPGTGGTGFNKLRSLNQTCPVVITMVLNPETGPCPAPPIAVATFAGAAHAR